MDQKWLLILVILGFCQITSGAVKSAKEGDKTEISCTPQNSAGASMIVWFRVLDSSGMEFIGSFSTTGIKKTVMPNFDEIFSYSTNRLTLKSFQRKDSGTYSCAALVSGTKLTFGEVTKIEGGEISKTAAPPTCTTASSVTTTPSCVCGNKNGGVFSSSMSCTPIIWGSLAGGCGLLLLLLILTILYCNRIRTRRCPHHHKRSTWQDKLKNKHQ
uniref:T-cell surface glycoprotein CD8 alpha chain n=1 Tax=Amphilophus citrinellus TaxID=61819 RepID=A0A3Q0R494_AMPCI